MMNASADILLVAAVIGIIALRVCLRVVIEVLAAIAVIAALVAMVTLGMRGPYRSSLLVPAAAHHRAALAPVGNLHPAHRVPGMWSAPCAS